MKKTFAGAAAAAILASALAMDANAVPFEFTHTSLLTTATGSLGTVASVGDAVTIEVTVDNGGASIISQTWSFTDTVSAELTVGGYSATYLDAFLGSASSFVTDGLGNLTSVGWVGTNVTLGASFDNFGVGPNVRLFNGGISDFNTAGLSSFYSPNLSTFNAWSGPLTKVDPIPEPGTLLLLGSGMVGMGAVARRRRQK